MDKNRDNKRRGRTWAPSMEGVGKLKRSAKKLADSASGILARPEVAKSVERLRRLMGEEEKRRMAQADVIVVLIDRHGLRAIDLGRQLSIGPQLMTNMYRTARAFPKDKRPKGVRYNHMYLAALMTRKYKALNMTPLEALAELQRSKLTQHRDVGAHFGDLARAALKPKPDIERAAPTGMILGRFQDHLAEFADGSIKLLVVDPPFWYPRRAREGYDAKGATSIESDNADGTDAVQTAVDVLACWQSKLAPGGTLLLWQATQMLHPDIFRAMWDNGWGYDRLVWDKSRPQPGNLDSAFSVQTEDLYVLYRRGETPKNHDGSARTNILRFAALSRPRSQTAQLHGFEKPVEMMKHLVGKLTFPGELVVELCGCTAPTTLAAVEMGRRWAYVESNTKNFELGRQRIDAALQRSQPKTA